MIPLDGRGLECGGYELLSCGDLIKNQDCLLIQHIWRTLKMRQSQNKDNNYRQWTAEEIARAELTEPISPSAYVSPAGPYIVELYARHVHHVESKIDSHLPTFSK